MIEVKKNIDPNIIHNPEFNNDPINSITAEFLANTNLQEWVHSLPEILPQGRTHFWRAPSIRTTNFSNEEEEEDDEEIADENKIQISAPLLQPISDDKLLYTNQTPWSIGLTMSIMHEYSLCYVRSNLWPGAFTLGHAEYVLSDLNKLLIHLLLEIILIYMLVGDKNMNNLIHLNLLYRKLNFHKNLSKKMIQLSNLKRLDVQLLQNLLVKKKIMMNHSPMKTIKLLLSHI
jgi:hypothetical protein